MKEYIERAVVKEKILSWAVCINHPELLSKEDTMHCINSLPAADVAEVRHGRWIETGYACGENEYQCSECKETEWRTSASRLKYCPFCGAKMDGGEAD